MKLEPNQHLRVKETFYASGVAVKAGWVVRVDWLKTDVDPDARRFDLTISLTPTEPTAGTILWARTSPLDEAYLDQLFEPA